MATYPFLSRTTPAFSHAITLGALDRLFPRARLEAILAETHRTTERYRRLELGLILLLVIALSLFARESQHDLLRRLCHAWRLRWPARTRPTVPTAPAIVYRRRELGVAPLQRLVRTLCVPLASPETPGAFLGGYRLMALDGTVDAVVDTPANARYFRRPSNQHGPGAYPQVQSLYLVECGTHAVVGACCSTTRRGEIRQARTLLPRVTSEMLVTMDRGLYSFDLLTALHARGATALVRVPSGVSVRTVAALPDGSYLARIYPADDRRRRRGEHLVIRLIEYTLPHAQVPALETTYRLVCTGLNYARLPAQMVAEAYTQRWEAESMLDEQTVHQRLPHAPLRSQTPQGVYQELYGAVLAHYALCTVRVAAAQVAAVDPDRISFVQTLRAVERYLPDCQLARGRQWHQRYRHLIQEVSTYLLPPRRPRAYPRLVKRRINRYTIRTPARIAAWRTAQTTRQVERL